MLTPCWPRAGPTGGAGVALPAGSCNLTIALTRLATNNLLQLLDLEEIELHGCLAAEECDQHLELVALRHHLIHDAQELREGSVDDLDVFALLKGHGNRRLFLRRHVELEDAAHLALLQRDRLGARGDETGHTGSVAHDVPGLVVHDHLHQHIAGKDLALHGVALAMLDLDLIFHRHDHLKDAIGHAHGFDAMFEILLYLIFVACIRVDDVPLALANGLSRHCCAPSLLPKDVLLTRPSWYEPADRVRALMPHHPDGLLISDHQPDEEAQHEVDRAKERAHHHADGNHHQGEVARLFCGRPRDLAQLAARFSPPLPEGFEVGRLPAAAAGGDDLGISGHVSIYL